MTPVQFGRALVESGDLDPIYVMLRTAGLALPIRQRWSLAYWLFYHAGVATRLAALPQAAFWDGVQQGLDDKWPRGTERRHFRGKQAQTTVDKLRNVYATPDAAVSFITGKQGSKQTFHEVKARALTWWGFGEWISFKMVDMTDAVLGVPVDFTGTEAHFFDAPKTGAWLVLQHYAGTSREEMEEARGMTDAMSDREAVERAITECLLPELASLRAPHAPSRPLALQEYETILCKYKSHLSGHYPVGHDTKHIFKALEWADTPLAATLHSALNKATTP